MNKTFTLGSMLSLTAAAMISFAPAAMAQPECATPHGAADGTPCSNVTPGGGTTGTDGGGPYIGGAGCIPGRVCNNGDD